MITLPSSVAGVGVAQIKLEHGLDGPKGERIASVVLSSGGKSNVLIHQQQYASLFTASEIAAAAARYAGIEPADNGDDGEHHGHDDPEPVLEN